MKGSMMAHLKGKKKEWTMELAMGSYLGPGMVTKMASLILSVNYLENQSGGDLVAWILKGKHLVPWSLS